MKVTPTGPGSIMTELTPHPEDNDVDSYRIHISEKSCRVRAGAVPVRCEITGLEDGTRHFLVARECFADGACGFGVYQYVNTLPRGTFFLPILSHFSWAPQLVKLSPFFMST